MPPGASNSAVNGMVVLQPEIQDALERGVPVVALESTIISHGFPWPQNLEVAQAAEAAVRKEGGVPATIAILDGVLRIGLDKGRLEALATRAADVAQGSDAIFPWC